MWVIFQICQIFFRSNMTILISFNVGGKKRGLELQPSSMLFRWVVYGITKKKKKLFFKGNMETFLMILNFLADWNLKYVF